MSIDPSVSRLSTKAAAAECGHRRSQNTSAFLGVAQVQKGLAWLFPRTVGGRFLLAAFAVLGLVTGAGCGGKKRPQFLDGAVPVTGMVTVDGKPLVRATVTLTPDVGSTGGRQAVAITREDGSYEAFTSVPGLSPEESKGVVPGTYAVTISCIAMPDGAALPADIIDEHDAVSRGAKQLVPVQFTNVETTKLRVTIAPPSVQHDLAL